MSDTPKPFLYELIPCGEDSQDYLFRRIRGKTPAGRVPWGLFINLDDPNPEQALIFVRGNVPPDEIHNKIVKAHAYWDKQIQPHRESGEDT